MAVCDIVSTWKVSNRAGDLLYLVLEVDGGIEVWNLRIDRLANDFSFAGVKEGAHFWHSLSASRGTTSMDLRMIEGTSACPMPPKGIIGEDSYQERRLEVHCPFAGIRLALSISQ
jgi:hypothetical protein